MRTGYKLQDISDAESQRWLRPAADQIVVKTTYTVSHGGGAD